MLARDHRHDRRSWEFRWWMIPGWSFRIVTVISLTTGTLFLMWLGDQITERGIGNGISLIITIGIVARLPAALAQAWKTFVPSAETGASQVNPAILVLMVAFLVHRHRGGHRGHAGRAQDHRAVREARRRPKNVRRADAIHAAEGELRRRHADHFRLGALAFPDHDRRPGFQEQPDGADESPTMLSTAGRITSFWRR